MNEKHNNSTNKKYRNYKNKNRNKKRSPNKKYSNKNSAKLFPSEKIFNDWLDLISKQVKARKSYFNLFGSEKYKQISKLKNAYDQVLKELINFEKKIPQQLLSKFLELKSHNQEDLDYSQLDLDHCADKLVQGETSLESEESDLKMSPHFKQSQETASHDYNDDKTESTGSMDDYMMYKGL